ncbi:MAG TPA: hypothetical protein VII33_00230, partial [Nakamurella sp.]
LIKNLQRALGEAGIMRWPHRTRRHEQCADFSISQLPRWSPPMTDLIWPAWLRRLVNVRATFRITLLVMDDIISDPQRARVTRLGEH